MNDILFIIQILGATALIVAPAILVKGLLGTAEGGTLADLFAIPTDPPWPRGVQEEEPTRWRFESLREPPKSARRAVDLATPRPQTQPATLGAETGRCA